MVLTEPLAWIDLEMTGLDPAVDVILEIAVILTNGTLDEVIEGPELVIAAPEGSLENMVPVVAEMHTKSGLLERVGATSTSTADAEQAVVEFIRTHVSPDQTLVLAGNSIHADRAFIRAYMPSLNALLHYRHVDVSTLKELARRWMPEVLASAPRKQGDHRAMTDIRESIDELRHYRRVMFASEAQEPQ